MARKLLIVMLISGIVAVAYARNENQSDEDGIKQAALDYAQGWYEGSGERMERAVHPDLAKRILAPHPRSGKGKIEHMSALTLVQATRSGSGTKTPTDDRKHEVTVLDVYGNAASARVEMHDWIDYLHLSKIGDRWVIVNVLWEFTPAAKKRYGIPDKL